jgi:hypothetical protein
MHHKLKYLLLTALVITIASCTLFENKKGTLSGHVTLGPLVPVLREGEVEPTPSPEMYAAWQIVIYTEDMQREVGRGNIDSAGNYQVSLPASTYMVTAELTGGGGGPGGSDFYSVEITKDKVTYLDLDIDTGIR